MDQNLYESLRVSLAGEGSSLARLLNALSLLHQSLGEDSWVGLYVYDDKDKVLNLGPFQGSPACVKIPPDKGVVGKCFTAKRPVYVDDVSQCPEYISCDPKVKSEVCFPMFAGEEVIGVLDIDSPKLDAFNDEELRLLMQIAHLFEN
jgi:L-methionine (R)-S-oxide reductase